LIFLQCSDPLALLVGRWEGHPACKKTGCWFVGGDDELTETLHVLQLRFSPLTTSIILSSDKIHNGDILVPANQDSPGKMAVKTETVVIAVYLDD